MISSAAIASATSEVTSITCLDDLRSALAPVREKLLRHPLYDAVNTIPRLRSFMSQHVFAVWDFMCLAKRLQRDLTSLQDLWLPPASASLARFINGVVHGEESDLDADGNAASHFELYLAAMDEVGAPSAPPRRFIALLREGGDVKSSLIAVGASEATQHFVRHTLTTAQSTTVEVLASFLFGREDLIPEMFTRLLPEWTDSREASRFAYYIKRHIELDGDDHGPAGLRALAELAGDQPLLWESAWQAADAAISARLAFWDGAYARVINV